jgi:hypothetical protein
VKKILKQMLERAGFGILRLETLEELRKHDLELTYVKNFMEFQNCLYTSTIPTSLTKKALEEFPRSKSQIQQDLFALMVSNFRFGGYFVEFGATNGVTLSNTFLLEKYYGWTGILAEPARGWHTALLQNRSAIIETKCVWSSTGKILMFNETKVGELSTVDALSSHDMHSQIRKEGQKYEVETVTLEDLLTLNKSPKFIDFLSIDTEGSEFEVLNVFNFEKYVFGFICCEHNYTANRDLVFDLLTSKGYIRIFSSYSKFDDWYIHKSVHECLTFNENMGSA